MLKRFIRYYKPHLGLFVKDMIACFFMSLCSMIYPIITRLMLNDLIPNRNFKMIIVCGLTVLGLYILYFGLNYYMQYKGHMMGVRMQADMRSDLFNHLQKLPFSYFDNHETGKIMTNITSDLFEVTEMAHHAPEIYILSTLTLILSFGYLISINWKLALILLACVPLLLVVAFKTRNARIAAFKKTRAAVSEINASIETSISGIRVTKAFTNASKESAKFEARNLQYQEANKSAYRAFGIFQASTTFITQVFNVIVLIAGGLFLYAGEINFADYSTFIVSINLFLNPINNLIRFQETFQNGATGFKRFCDAMDEVPELDQENARPVERLKGEVEFKSVSFSYDGDREVLHSVSLKIPAGKTYALVGPSGGGKTTICHLIPHFYSITKGEILIDGQNINSLQMESLRQNIGIVQQDIYLFNASIRDNILYGRLDATEEEVIEAAKLANIHDYILSLPEGYDTVIGERGVRLSGGQKQRLCIARVFLKNPPLLILDEATSALDNATEILIQEALDKLSEGRTTLVVAHRLSTIQNADEIAVIGEGTIKEQGTHEELMAQNGIYAGLYQQQFRRDYLLQSELTAQHRNN